MKAIIWGTGNYYEKYYYEIKMLNVIAIVDNNVKKQGTYIDDIRIVAPKQIRELEFDRIYIVCLAINEVHKQILDLGIGEEKIYFFFDLPSLRKSTLNVIKSNTNMNGKRIAMISHDFSVTGAQNCLLQVAKWLVKKGCYVKVGAPYDGELKLLFREIGAESFVDERLKVGTLEHIEWIDDCEMLVVNTVQMYYLLRKRNVSIPLIWWLHEPTALYKSVVPNIINRLLTADMKVYTISKLADAAFHTVCDNIQTKQLLYGIEDNKTTAIKHKSVLMRFIVIGEISKLKGHDILLDAIKLLNKEELARCEFIFVGEDSSDFAQKILRELRELQINYRATGLLSHKAALSELSNSDVLICASRVETMSMATTEAMMQERPVIVSDAAGIVEFIVNGENGYIFESENTQGLAENIRYAIRNRKKMEKVGKQGRKVFENIFEIGKFEDSLQNVFKII